MAEADPVPSMCSPSPPSPEYGHSLRSDPRPLPAESAAGVESRGGTLQVLRLCSSHGAVQNHGVDLAAFDVDMLSTSVLPAKGCGYVPSPVVGSSSSSTKPRQVSFNQFTQFGVPMVSFHLYPKHARFLSRSGGSSLFVVNLHPSDVGKEYLSAARDEDILGRRNMLDFFGDSKRHLRKERYVHVVSRLTASRLNFPPTWSSCRYIILSFGGFRLFGNKVSENSVDQTSYPNHSVWCVHIMPLYS